MPEAGAGGNPRLTMISTAHFGHHRCRSWDYTSGRLAIVDEDGKLWTYYNEPFVVHPAISYADQLKIPYGER